MKRYRCIVQGRVQGVWYRRHVSEAAREAGLKGYVRNLPDGTVEAVADLDETTLPFFKALLKKGSPMSVVTGLSCEEIEAQKPYSTFEVRR